MGAHDHQGCALLSAPFLTGEPGAMDHVTYRDADALKPKLDLVA